MAPHNPQDVPVMLALRAKLRDATCTLWSVPIPPSIVAWRPQSAQHQIDSRAWQKAKLHDGNATFSWRGGGPAPLSAAVSRAAARSAIPGPRQQLQPQGQLCMQGSL